MLKVLRCVFALLLIAMLALGYRVLPALNFNSDLMAVFPQGVAHPEVAHAHELLAEAGDRKVFFLLSSSEWSATKKAAATLTETLRDCHCFADIVDRQNIEGFNQLRQIYTEHAPLLLSKKDKILLQQGQGETLVSSSLKDHVDNPAATTTRAHDPLQTVDDFIAGLRGWVAGKGKMDDGYLYFSDATTDRQYLLVVAKLQDSPHAVEVQKTAHQVIEAAQRAFSRSVAEAEILRAGTLFFSLSDTAKLRGELVFVGLGALLVTLVLVLFVFHSLRALFLSLLQLGLASIAGLIAIQGVFGSVYMIALVMSATTLGVISIFSFRLFCRWQALASAWHAQATQADLLPGVTVKLLALALSFLALSAVDIAGLRQFAVFSCAAIVTAYMTLVAVYPWVLRNPRPVASPRWLTDRIPRYLAVARRRLRCLKHPEWLLPFVALVAMGFWQLEIQDDVGRVRALEVTSASQHNRFNALVSQVTPAQYLLVKADSQETLLHKLEQLQPALDQPTVADALAGYTHLAQWLPSQAAQLENHSLIRQQLITTGRLEDYLNTVSSDPQSELARFQAEPNGNLLMPDTVLPLLHNLLQYPLYYTDDNKHYGYILFKGVEKTEPLQQLAADNENVFWVDERQAAASLLERHRHFASGLLIANYLVLLALLCLRYRVKGALRVITAPLLASLIAVACLGWLGIGLSLFVIVALLLVLGIGALYPLILRQSDGYDSFFAAGLSCLVTLVSLACLSFSGTHAVFSFGITLLLGVGASFMLSPLALPKGVPHQK